MNLTNLYKWDISDTGEFTPSTLTKELSKLNTKELKLCLQGMKDDLKRYEVNIKNYSESKMQRYGTPHRNRIVNIISKLEEELSKRNLAD